MTSKTPIPLYPTDVYRSKRDWWKVLLLSIIYIPVALAAVVLIIAEFVSGTFNLAENLQDTAKRDYTGSPQWQQHWQPEQCASNSTTFELYAPSVEGSKTHFNSTVLWDQPHGKQKAWQRTKTTTTDNLSPTSLYSVLQIAICNPSVYLQESAGSIRLACWAEDCQCQPAII